MYTVWPDGLYEKSTEKELERSQLDSLSRTLQAENPFGVPAGSLKELHVALRQRLWDNKQWARLGVVFKAKQAYHIHEFIHLFFVGRRFEYRPFGLTGLLYTPVLGPSRFVPPAHTGKVASRLLHQVHDHKHLSEGLFTF
jgi:hypothetical protein